MRSDDAELHAQGAAKFTGDLPAPADRLFIHPVAATIAHGIILHIDLQLALAYPGVAAALTAADIAGLNQVGNVAADEVLLAETEVVFYGQPLALIVATSPECARHAADLVKVEYQILPAVFDAREADRQGLYIAPKRIFNYGDVASAWAHCDLIVEGSASTGAQEHMYLETQTAIAYPLEG